MLPENSYIAVGGQRARTDTLYIDFIQYGVNQMEKYRIHPIGEGKSMRMSYQRQKEVLPMPNLIEVQTDSYKWFLEKGLQEVFDDLMISLRSRTSAEG